MSGSKTGIVLEGGAMRGLYTAGVLDVFMENGVYADCAFGTSAGACFGVNYKSRQTGRTLRYNLKYCGDKRYGSFSSLIKTGDYYGADFCYRKIPCELDPFDTKTFSENPMEFFAVCTNAVTGGAVYEKLSDGGEKDLLYIRASASMPLVSKAVKVDGLTLFDGGIADSIPLQASIDHGCSKNIVVLTRPEGYVKKPAGLMGLFKMLYGKYPAMIKAMAERHINYNDSLMLCEKEQLAGNAVIIRPTETVDIKRTEHNPEVLQKMYDLGRKDGLAKLEEVKAFMKR